MWDPSSFACEPGQRCTAFDPVQTLERSASRLRLREGPTFGLGEGARFIGKPFTAEMVRDHYKKILPDGRNGPTAQHGSTSQSPRPTGYICRRSALLGG